MKALMSSAVRSVITGLCACMLSLGFNASSVVAQSAQDQMHQQRDQQQQQQTNDYYNRILPEQQRQQQQNSEGHSVPAAFPFVSVAWHVGAKDVFVATRNANEASNIEEALEACEQIMGSGCQLAATVRDGSIAIARDVTTNLWWGEGPDNASARRDAMRKCSSQSSGCSPISVFNAHDRLRMNSGASSVYIPTDLSRLRYRYAAMATTPIRDGDDRRRDYWISTGYLTQSEADAAALQSCVAALGGECFVTRRVTDGVIGLFRSGPRSPVEASNENIRALRQSVRSHCASHGFDVCEEVAILDATGQSSGTRGQITPRVQLVSIN